MKRRVMLGMSGGVDSSVAAALLLEMGYDVEGVTLKLRPESLCGDGGCDSPDDIKDAGRVAEALGIPHHVFEFTDVFTDSVIDGFVQEYLSGRTPNPCIVCNRRVKFGAMLEKALEMGMDYVATGHYAVIERDASGRYLLRRSCAAKDQSYVLYGLTQHQLSHTLFPLGDMEKSAVRAMAHRYGLPVAEKRDSQEICFVNDGDYAGFIERYTGCILEPGEFVDADGKTIGIHKGITHYTIGQRKGLGGGFAQPMYVTAIRPETNQIVLGPEGSQYTDRLVAHDLNWISVDKIDKERDVMAKVRYQARPALARIRPSDNGCMELRFMQPQRAVTPGQAVVFYDGEYVLGGGTILFAGASVQENE